MNTGALITVFFVGVALFWGFWLIFRRDLFSMNLGKLLSYFAGVILTLLLVAWMTSKFLPWWAVRLVSDTRNSPNVQELQNITQGLWQEVANPAAPTVIAPTEQPTAASQPTGEGVVTPTPASQPSTPSAEMVAPQTAALKAGEQSYVVQTGDTLYSISRRFNVSVDAIRQRNNLTSDTIQVGQQLIIPAP